MNVKKGLPQMIGRRISGQSSNMDEFEAEVAVYSSDLKASVSKKMFKWFRVSECPAHWERLTSL